MRVLLVMKTSDGSERSFPLRNHDSVIGREETCDVRVPIPKVSMQHCRISYNGTEVKLRDLNSEDGTYVNGNRTQETTLTHQDTLTVGPVSFTVKIDSHKDGSAESQPEIMVESQSSQHSVR